MTETDNLTLTYFLSNQSIFTCASHVWNWVKNTVVCMAHLLTSNGHILLHLQATQQECYKQACFIAIFQFTWLKFKNSKDIFFWCHHFSTLLFIANEGKNLILTEAWLIFLLVFPFCINVALVWPPMLGIVGWCWILLDDVGHCWVMLDIVGWCWILLDDVGYCWVMLDIVGWCWTKFDLGQKFWMLLDVVGWCWNCLATLPSKITFTQAQW